MQKKITVENISWGLLILIILMLPVYLLRQNRVTRNKTEQPAYTYVGGTTCIQCHAKEYQLWKGSHHDRAMDIATDSTVLGNFNNAEITTKNGITHKFYKKDNRFYVFTEGQDGAMKEFEVKYTFGFTPLQNYLVELAKGRLQTLHLTWNSADSSWYHMGDSVYKNENLTADNWLHWTNQAQNWNGMCADCHSTNVVKGYNVETDTYNTTFSDIDVNCEACHGPSSQHLEWANLPEYSRDGYENFGLPVKTNNLDNFAYVDQCARCHTRRASISDYQPSNSNIFTHMMPSLPTKPEYFIDGQILDEDYVYGSFTQSKMYMHDIKCNDCHDVHSGKRHFDGNQLCLQCHKAEDYDTPRHHFHKNYGAQGNSVISESGITFKVGDGAQCVNCHMHGRYYMGVDYRNDHSFRIPRPDLSEKLGVPNACNQCHANKTNQWAQSYIENWYGKTTRFQYGEALAQAEKGTAEGLNLLIKIIDNDLYPPMVRATAIQYLGNHYPDSSQKMLLPLLQSMEPLIRHTAVRTIQIADIATLQAMLPLLNDEMKTIRIECAFKIVSIPNEQIPENYKAAWNRAESEYFESLKYNADFPIGRFNLANYYFNNQQFELAEKYYLDALEMDNQLHIVKVNLAYLYNATGKSAKAKILFADYLKYNPTDGNVLFAYALLLSELKEYDASLEYLLLATKAQPDNARIDFNVANMYIFYANKPLAEKYFKSALDKQPDSQEFYTALLQFYTTNGMAEKANKLKANYMLN